MNLRLCVAFSPLPSLHSHFPDLPRPKQTTCVAILRSLSIHNDTGLSHVYTFWVHSSSWCSCFGRFMAFHAYLSERPVAFTSLVGWGLPFLPHSTSYLPLGRLPSLSPHDGVQLSRTPLSLLLSGTRPFSWDQDSLTPLDSGCCASNGLLSLLVIKLFCSML